MRPALLEWAGHFLRSTARPQRVAARRAGRCCPVLQHDSRIQEGGVSRQICTRRRPGTWLAPTTPTRGGAEDRVSERTFRDRATAAMAPQPVPSDTPRPVPHPIRARECIAEGNCALEFLREDDQTCFPQWPLSNRSQSWFERIV